jgi:3-isopropylmalate/(R)-2-methylmalate dehydratase large subunit
MVSSTPRTLYDKLWDSHLVRQEQDGTAVIYIDRHLVHEVTSPQAYEGLTLAGRKQWRVDSVVATADHNTPTKDWDKGIADPVSRLQVETLDDNIKKFGAKVYFPFLDRRQGIVHVIGPEQGATLPGMTVVCGDSHTSTHGAFGALAFGIGTSEVEHVLATQCMVMKKSKTMQVVVDGRLPDGVTARQAAGWRHREGHHARGYRQNRQRRRHRLCNRIRRLGNSRLEHGRPHDPLQHGDRSRCAYRSGSGR